MACLGVCFIFFICQQSYLPAYLSQKPFIVTVQCRFGLQAALKLSTWAGWFWLGLAWELDRYTSLNFERPLLTKSASMRKTNWCWQSTWKMLLVSAAKIWTSTLSNNLFQRDYIILLLKMAGNDLTLLFLATFQLIVTSTADCLVTIQIKNEGMVD